MGNVAHAVAEFDEAVRAPWRPPLRSVAGDGRPALHLVPGGQVRRGAAAGGEPPRGAAAVQRAPQQSARARVGARPTVGRAGGPRPQVAAALRLTPRARRLAVVLAVGLGVAVGALVDSAVSGGAGEQLRLVGESTVVVRPGDTLWSIAGTIAGDEDLRGVVDAIQQLNGLEGAGLVPGQTLQLP
ncbi:LysM peptidoglycan-binding domain-containing protein [Blastococcus sp. TF02A-30]|uniref:LysM peptidoglycan-binding domain-containing protein n=1 Tax=Blastococcus sp. TF02A-30 TaxID=2250580 RepID=UPI000DEAF65C|nr:LysM peptidoglycan-binding domain-containing protein [Blastococcus sp. TF02A-30]RBY90966.1 LysM peptidoglycan-binding domain-containing protein [Blastococcus sp. TF02A-30]